MWNHTGYIGTSNQPDIRNMAEFYHKMSKKHSFNNNNLKSTSIELKSISNNLLNQI